MMRNRDERHHGAMVATMRNRSRWARIWSLVWLVVVCCGASAAPASADIAQLECVGTQASHYEPGLTFTPQPVTSHVMGVVGPCVGLPLTLVSATFESGSTGVRSCDLGEVTPGLSPVFLTLKWNDGTSSLAQQTSVAITRPLGQVIIVSTNQVVEGRFLNATVVRTQTLLQADLLACATPEGVRDTAGPTTITISGMQ